MVDITATRRARASVNFFVTAVHGTLYDYSKVEYTDSTTKVIIGCPTHGDLLQQPVKHINLGNGCKECVLDDLLKPEAVYYEELAVVSDGCVERLSPYIGTNYKILQRHNWGHEWEVSPSSLLAGKGNPVCSEYGFNAMKPAILYYLHVENQGEVAYKIGITNSTVKDRFRGVMQFITVLKEWTYDVGADAYQAEQSTLKLNREFKYEGALLLRSGNTELFYKDVGELENE